MSKAKKRRITAKRLGSPWLVGSDFEFRVVESRDRKALYVVLDLASGERGIGICGGKDIDITARLLRTRVFPALASRAADDSSAALFALVLSPGFPTTNPTKASDYKKACATRKARYPLSFGSARVVYPFELNYKFFGVCMNKAICGVDSAILDLLGFDEMFADWLPTRREKNTKSEVYASSLSRKVSFEKLCFEIEKLHSVAGISTFKLKAGVRNAGVAVQRDVAFDPDSDVGMRVARAMPHLEFMLDFNGALTIDEFSNIQLPSNVVCAEEPFCHLSTTEYEMVNNCGNEVAAFECEYDLNELKRLAPFVGWVQVDLGYLGGPFAAMEALTFAAEHLKKRVSVHSPQPDANLLWAIRISKFFDFKVEACCLDDGLAQLDLKNFKLRGLEFEGGLDGAFLTLESVRLGDVVPYARGGGGGTDDDDDDERRRDFL